MIPWAGPSTIPWTEASPRERDAKGADGRFGFVDLGVIRPGEELCFTCPRSVCAFEEKKGLSNCALAQAGLVDSNGRYRTGKTGPAGPRGR